MKKSVVIIKKNLFIYNGEEYDFDKVNEMNNLLKSNLKIIILEEELYVKQFKIEIKRNKIYEFIDYKINNDFPQNSDSVCQSLFYRGTEQNSPLCFPKAYLLFIFALSIFICFFSYLKYKVENSV